ncbi:MAG: hypothetical protein GY906_12770 [bacterium]|nr:hypothetical protein [bacterium]
MAGYGASLNPVREKLGATVDKLRAMPVDATLDTVEDTLRFDGVTWSDFQWLDEKPGLWGNSESSGGEWHYHVRQLRNARGYRGNEVTVTLKIDKREYRDGSNPDHRLTGEPYYHVSTAMPGEQDDSYSLIKALEPGSVLGRAFHWGDAIHDYMERFRDYSDAIALRIVKESETKATVVITVNKNRNERN